MKKTLLTVSLLLLSACTAYGPVNRSINTDLKSAATTDSIIDQDIRLTFGNSSRIRGKKLGMADALKSHRYVSDGSDLKTRANVACKKAFIDAVNALKQQAIEKGGNAVVDINSYWRENSSSSSETYYCQGGKTKSAVGLRGIIVKE